jgi:hypothetical protein
MSLKKVPKVLSPLDKVKSLTTTKTMTFSQLLAVASKLFDYYGIKDTDQMKQFLKDAKNKYNQNVN